MARTGLPDARRRDMGVEPPLEALLPMTPLDYARHAVPQLPDGPAHWQFTKNDIWFRQAVPATHAFRLYQPTHR